jgi:hypothetical protein
VNKQPTGLDPLQYLATLVTDPEQVISRIYQMDGASLYKVADDHYVCVSCLKHKHKGRPLLERVLPQTWECFASAVNVEDQFEVFHYGPAE